MERREKAPIDDYPRPLAGDRSVSQLTRLIARTMPKDTDDKCSGEDAQKVAAYIYDAFYSKTAQARNKPPRIELSRLTVRQYRQRRRRPDRQLPHAQPLGPATRPARRVFQVPALPRQRPRPGARRSRGPLRLRRRPARTPRSSTPINSRSAGRARSWPRTPASYEFIVRTEHAARLWVNDTQTAADRRLGEVGQRYRVSRLDLPAGRARLSAAAGVLQGQAGRGRLEEQEGQAARKSRRRSRWRGSRRSGRRR